MPTTLTLATLIASIPDGIENAVEIKAALSGESPLVRYLESKDDDARLMAVKIMSIVGVPGYLNTVQDGIEAFLTRKTTAARKGDDVVYGVLATVAWHEMDRHYDSNFETLRMQARRESGQLDYDMPATFSAMLARTGRSSISATVEGAGVDYTVGVNGEDTDKNTVSITLDAAVVIRLDGRTSARCAPAVFAAWKKMHGTDHPDRASYLAKAATQRKEKKAEKDAATK
jgi:hypothetical protein